LSSYNQKTKTHADLKLVAFIYETESYYLYIFATCEQIRRV